MPEPIKPVEVIDEIAQLHFKLSQAFVRLKGAMLNLPEVGPPPLKFKQEDKAEQVKTVGEHAADAGVAVEPPKTEKPKKEKPVKEAKPADSPKAAAPTPEQLKQNVMTKLVALCGKNRTKASEILADVGAKKFSEVQPENYAEVLLALEGALAGGKDEDPLA